MGAVVPRRHVGRAGDSLGVAIVADGIAGHGGAGCLGGHTVRPAGFRTSPVAKPVSTAIPAKRFSTVVGWSSWDPFGFCFGFDFGFSFGLKCKSFRTPAARGFISFDKRQKKRTKEKRFPRQNELGKRVFPGFSDSPSMARSENSGHPCPLPSGSACIPDALGRTAEPSGSLAPICRETSNRHSREGGNPASLLQ